MTTWFISRHPGAVEWASRQGLAVDQYAAHLDPAQVQPGDTVVGSLPVNLAAAICEHGARYFHLSLELPAWLRGRELSADQLNALRARLEEYRVENITGCWAQTQNEAMSAVLSPIESEFATVEEAQAHDRWFRAQVQASLDDPRPCIAHDQVMAEMDQIIAQAEQRLSAKPA